MDCCGITNVLVIAVLFFIACPNICRGKVDYWSDYAETIKRIIALKRMNDEGFTITSKGVQNGVNEGPLATLPNEQRAKPMEKVFDSNDVSYDNGDVDDTDEGRTSQNNDAKRQPEFGLDRCQRVKMEYRGICIRSVLAEAAMEVGEAAVDIMKQDALNQVHRIQKRLDDENALLILSKK